MRSTPWRDMDANVGRKWESAGITYSKVPLSSSLDKEKSILREKGSEMVSSGFWSSSDVTESISQRLRVLEANVSLECFSKVFQLMSNENSSVSILVSFNGRPIHSIYY